MSDYLDPIVVELAADISAYTASLDVADQRMGSYADIAVAAATRASEVVTSSAATVAEAAAAQADQVTVSSSQVSAAMREVARSAEVTQVTWAQNLGLMDAEMTAMVRSLEAQAAKAEAATAGVGTAMAEAAAEAKGGFASGLAGSKGALLGVGAAAIGVTYETAKMASSFDASMQLIATQAHAGQAEVKAMSNTVLDLAGAVGIGPEKLAEGLYHVESTGLRGAAAMAVLEASAHEAAIGLADFDSVTYAMSGVMSVALKDVKDAADGVAYLNTIVGTGDMRMQDLASAIGTGVLPTFKSAGLGMRDFGSALAVMTDNSMPAEQAANHLKTAVQLLQNQSGPARKALESIGIGANQLANDLQKPNGFLVAIQDIKTHLESSGKSAAEQGQIISKAFGGARSAATIEEMVGQIDKLKGKYSEMGTVGERAKQQQDDWAKTQETSTQKWKEFTAAIQALAIRIGNDLLPPLTAALGWILKGVQWLEQHKLAAEILAGVIGTVLVGAFVALTVAMLSNPAVLITMGIIALIAAIVLLVTHWQQVEKFLRGVWDGFVSWAKDIWDHIAGFFTGLWDDVVGFFSSLPGKIGDALSGLGSLLAGIASKAWQAFLSAMKTAGHAVLEFVKNLPHEIGFAIGFLVGMLFRLGWDAINGLRRGIVNAAVAVWDFFRDLPGRVNGFVNKAGEWLVDKGKDLLVGLGHGIEDGFKAVVQWFKDLPGKIWNFFKDADQWEKEKGHEILVGLWNGIKDAWKDVVQWFKDLPGHILDFFKDAGTWLLHVGEDVIKGLWQGIKNIWNDLIGWISDIGGGIVDGFKSALGISSPSKYTYEHGRYLMMGLANGITDHAHLAVTAAQRMAAGLLDVTQGGVGGFNKPLALSSSAMTAASGQYGRGDTYITVQGSVLAERDLMRVVQRNTLRYNLRNTGNGLALGTV
jgi:TP901 family phage tail tape measure protein